VILKNKTDFLIAERGDRILVQLERILAIQFH